MGIGPSVRIWESARLGFAGFYAAAQDDRLPIAAVNVGYRSLAALTAA
jgi:hypothetical protein